MFALFMVKVNIVKRAIVQKDSLPIRKQYLSEVVAGYKKGILLYELQFGFLRALNF